MEDEKQKKISDLIAISNAGQASSKAQARSEQELQQRRKATQQRLLILCGAVILLNLVVAYFTHQILVVETTAASREALINQELESGVRAITQYTKEQQERLSKIASNTALIQTLEEQNNEQFGLLTESFKVSFDDLQQLRILSNADRDRLNEVTPPLSFAELSLVRRRLEGENTPPELIKKDDGIQLNLVQAVQKDPQSNSLGLVFVSLNAAKLKKVFGATNNDLGEKVLVQKIKGSSVYNVFKFGSASDSEQPQEINIPDSNWTLKFTPNEQLQAQATTDPLIFILVSCGIALVSLLGAVLLNRLLANRQPKQPKDLAPTVAEVTTQTLKTIDPLEESSVVTAALDSLDIALIAEDEDILGLNNNANKKQAPSKNLIASNDVPAHIFRSYDVRGIVGKDLTPELAELIGQAVGSEAIDAGEHSLLVGRDGRTHSELLTERLIKGILSTGCNVINLQLVPTPVLYYATYHYDDVRSGVMVTASHNPADYNGFKVVLDNQALSDDRILNLRDRILTGRIHKGAGEQSYREIIPQYIDRIFSDVALAGDVKLVIDAGNAVPGLVAPRLFEELGCEVIPLYCDLDGSFPHHEPDPTQEHNLLALIEKVKEENADMGVAFDGDGDRLVVVTPRGDIIWPDRMLMLFAKDILSRCPGADVLFDVKCTRQLNQVISGYGGRPIMWKTGHSPMKAKMLETGALIGGEYSGHIFIKDRWYGFDDGLYAMARLLEIITLRDQPIDEIFDAFPPLIITPEIKVKVPDERKFALVQQLAEQGDFQNGNMTTIDGIRVDYSKGWGLVRASNTSPALTLRFEAETEDALTFIKQVFKRELQKIDSNLTLNF